ncbi:MAG TPA: acetyl-CoA C-acyltransferase [Conexibacter sp.]|nr:acetyl-CoA C-acyltransferase [Conexibacter sp.]
MRGSDAYVVAAVRTPLGRRDGALSGWHPADLGAHVLLGVLERAGVDPGAVDDVIFGCVDQVGAQAGNLARTAWLSAGLPEHVPGTTVDRQCGSSQQAVHVAAQGIMAGSYDVAIAGGVEVMSLVPLLAATQAALGLGTPLSGRGWTRRYGDGEVSQFRGAELLIEQHSIDRGRMDAFALRSHQRATAAQRDGRLAQEIAAVDGFANDECIRADASLARMEALGPVFPDGTITAAQCSQISDGAAALVLASEEALRRHRLTPLARVAALGLGAADPITMLSGPIPATEAVLRRAGLTIGEIGRFEVNEAFAPVVLAWADAVGADLSRTNVRGGAIALGHPLGASGARIMTSLVHELQASGARYGLQTICEWGGTANATVLERV